MLLQCIITVQIQCTVLIHIIQYHTVIRVQVDHYKLLLLEMIAQCRWNASPFMHSCLHSMKINEYNLKEVLPLLPITGNEEDGGADVTTIDEIIDVLDSLEEIEITDSIHHVCLDSTCPDDIDVVARSLLCLFDSLQIYQDVGFVANFPGSWNAGIEADAALWRRSLELPIINYWKEKSAVLPMHCALARALALGASFFTL